MIQKGTPFTVAEARIVACDPSIDVYHRDLILWLCDELDKRDASADPSKSGLNMNKSPIHLEKFINKAECPVCDRGILVSRRDMRTFKMVAVDNCLFCGQCIIYDNLVVKPLYDVYRGGRIVAVCDSEKDAWDVIGQSWLGYQVLYHGTKKGVPEFIPY